jgi:putative membrane protein
VVVILLAGWYLRAQRRVTRSGESWPALRSVAWFAGVAIIAVATLSGLASWDQTSFSVHATIDVAVAMVAPVFLALGAPLTLAGAAAPAGRDRIDRVLAGRAARVLTHPVTGWVVFTGSLFALYSSGFFAAARGHESLLQLGHLELGVAGCLLIWPAVGSDPIPRRLGPGWRALDVLFGLLVYTVFGMTMDSRTQTVARGITMTDTHGGGDIIWSAGEVIALALAVGILYQWLFRDLRVARAGEEVDEETLAMQAAVWRVSRLLAKPEAVREAERAAAVKAETITVSSRQEPPEA